MKITVLDGSAANPGDITWAPLEELGELTVYDVTSQPQLIERAKDSEILITNKTVFNREAIEALPKLKYIGVLATGFNVIDLDACRERGIVVTNVPEYSTYATAQMATALILELTDLAGLHDRSVKDGDWIRSPQFCYWNKPLFEIMGKTVVVFGLGKIGRRVCAIMSALGAKVTGVPHHIPQDGSKSIKVDGYEIGLSTFEEALPDADIITFHCPLTPETDKIIRKENIDRCKDGVMIINAARGGLADEKDVADALRSGKIRGYAADVVSVEPMLPDNPLLTAPNTILTPHIAWAPQETRMRLINVCADNIRAFLNGCPVNVVS